MLQKFSVNRAVTHQTLSFAISKTALSGNSIRPVLRFSHGHRRLTTMASSDTVASAYASALASLAVNNKKLEVIHTDIEKLSSILKETEGLAAFLGNPVTDEAKKREVLSTLCKEAEFDRDTENFLNLVMDKGRAGFLHEMCERFEQEYCKKTDTLIATLTSAVQLDEEEQMEIAKKLRELSGAANVKLNPVLDPSLIAGFMLEYGSSQIDLSVRGQLARLSQELVEKSSFV